MYKKLIMKKSSLQVMMLIVVLGMTSPVLAVDHWWHGGISANVNDPANWTDRNSTNDPTTPGGNPNDIVRIGNAWGSEDIDEDIDGDGELDTSWPVEDNNGNEVLDLPNGVLDPGEDLNGNGVIDDPLAESGYNIVGLGGYLGSYDQGGVLIANGGGIDLDTDPVLSETYVSRNGTPNGGWWFVLNAPNILTLTDGAFLILNENSMIRNGGRVEVQGRSSTGGPSLIVARQYRISESGSIQVAAHETSQLRINGTGWMQVDTEPDGGASFMIGTSNEPGTMPRGEIIIENQGRLEILTDVKASYLDFGNTDPNVNQIIIRDDGELLLPGDPASMGRVGTANTVTSLQELIDMGLITNDQGHKLNVSGTNPTMISVAKPWATKPSPVDGKSDVERQLILSWTPSKYEVVYDVYIGTDVNSVTEATRGNPMDVLAVQGIEETSFDPDGLLNSNQTYYWRIDAVNDDPNSPWASPLWSFTTGDYIIIEDFESYNDINPDDEGSNRIYFTWSDGYDNPNVNGSTIGYPDPYFPDGEHFVETDIVHGGKQSGPFLYNNTNAGSSEVSLPISATAVGSNWTQGDSNVLTLWFYGDPSNPATESLYIKLNGSKVAYSGDAADISAGEWIQWDINLSDFGIALTNVTQLTVGTERAGATGSEGILFLDDIRLRSVVQ